MIITYDIVPCREHNVIYQALPYFMYNSELIARYTEPEDEATNRGWILTLDQTTTHIQTFLLEDILCLDKTLYIIMQDQSMQF